APRGSWATGAARCSPSPCDPDAAAHHRSRKRRLGRPLPDGDHGETAAGERVILAAAAKLSGYFLSAISWTSGFHWAISWLICARYCSGVVLTVSAPALRMMSFTSGSSAILIRISDN